MKHFNHFDFLAPIYDRIIKPAETDKLSIYAGLPKVGNLLDVGGGTGRSSILLTEKVTAVIIADSSKGMLSQAKKKNNFITVQSCSERLPFKNDTFPRIIMVDALHHVEDYKATLSELWRTVSIGGRIVIEEPDIQTLVIKLMAIFEKVILMRSHFISPQRIVKFFEFPNAKIKIEREKATAWVIIEKINL